MMAALQQMNDAGNCLQQVNDLSGLLYTAKPQTGRKRNFAE